MYAMNSSDKGTNSNTLVEEPLTVPTDIEIMELFSNGLRQTPQNVALTLDKDNGYMSERIGELKDREYICGVSPSGERGVMVVISDLGKIVAAQIHKYNRSNHAQFDAICRQLLCASEETADGLRISLTLSDKLYSCLEYCAGHEGLVIASTLTECIESKMGDSPTRGRVDELLYELFLYGLLEQKDNMPVYELTDKGRDVVSTGREQIEISVR